MEANNILTADVLDIIFDGRNKSYGAYELRKTYQQRLGKSIMIMGGIVGLLFVAYVVAGKVHLGKDKLQAGPDVVLGPVNPIKEKEQIIIPPKSKEIQQNVEIKKFTKPLFVTEDPPEVEKPPVNDDLNKAVIGNINKNGNEDDGLVQTKEDVTGVVAITKKTDPNDGQTFTKVEIESEYPGGLSAWVAFLNRNLANNYPQQAADNEIQGTVIIQFIVDLQGNVSDVVALEGPKELRDAAITVIKKSGKWIPAIQNGQHVKSYKRQPITFKLATE